jgi:hypothetical protein
MALTNLLPRTINTTGASCTGSDGDSNRTYTLPDSGVLSSGELISINGTVLMEGVGNDYTMSGSVITFLNAVFDVNIILVNYFITFGAPAAAALSTSTSLKYATPLMLGETLGMVKDVPSWAVAGTPTNEAVGTGDGATLIFYLDQKSVVSDSYTLYADGSAMTETTHYTLDCDTGQIILTVAGRTLLSTDDLTAKYQYYDNGMKDSYIISVLSRAEKRLDNMVNSTFTDGTATNPAYPIATEIQASEGYYMDRIFVHNKPLIDISSAIDADITAADTTISLESASGGELFPTAGYIIIGSEVITYTGVSTDDLTGCSRGVLGTTAAAHSNGDAVHTTILMRSDTTEGTAVSWTVQPWDTSMHTDDDGMIYWFKDASPDPLTRRGVENRVKIIYLYGYDVVPGDITRLTLILAKRALMQDTIGKSIISGRDEFRPEMFNADEDEIKTIIGSYIVCPMGNT